MVATRVPGEMMRQIEARVRAGNYASTSEYLRDLMRQDLARRAEGPAATVVPDEASADPDLSRRTVVKVADTRSEERSAA